MTEPHPLPADWWPNERDYARAVERYPHIDVEALTRAFVFRNLDGDKCRKDWTATWRSVLIAANTEEVATLNGHYDAGNPPMYRGWQPDRNTLETLEEVLHDVDVFEELEAFTEKYAGVTLYSNKLRDLRIRSGTDFPFRSWTQAFRAHISYTRWARSMERRNRRKETEARLVAASTTRQRGHLRLLDPNRAA